MEGNIWIAWVAEKHKENTNLISPFLLCLFFTAAAVHRSHVCGICTGDGSDLPHDTCRREALSDWHYLHLAQDTHPGNKQKVSSRPRGEVPSWLPGLGRYHIVLSRALTKQCSSFSSQISAILYPVPDVLSQLPSPTWFMFVILSIKKLVIKMKPSFPILLPAITLLHLPIPRPLLFFLKTH